MPAPAFKNLFPFYSVKDKVHNIYNVKGSISKKVKKATCSKSKDELILN